MNESIGSVYVKKEKRERVRERGKYVIKQNQQLAFKAHQDTSNIPAGSHKQPENVELESRKQLAANMYTVFLHFQACSHAFLSCTRDCRAAI